MRKRYNILTEYNTVKKHVNTAYFKIQLAPIAKRFQEGDSVQIIKSPAFKRLMLISVILLPILNSNFYTRKGDYIVIHYYENAIMRI